MMRQVLVIGAGGFGQALAADLVAKGADVAVIEIDREKAEDLREEVSQIVVGDATDKDVLKKFAQDVDVAVVCISKRVDASLLVTHFLKELGVKKIIAKALGADHERILKIVGADEVISPDRDEAKRLAASLISPNLMDFIRLSEEFNMVEVAVPDEFAHRSIRELDLRNRYGVEVLAVKNALTGKAQVLPPPEHKFEPDDILIVVGDVESLERFRGQ